MNPWPAAALQQWGNMATGHESAIRRFLPLLLLALALLAIAAAFLMLRPNPTAPNAPGLGAEQAAQRDDEVRPLAMRDPASNAAGNPATVSTPAAQIGHSEDVANERKRVQREFSPGAPFIPDHLKDGDESDLPGARPPAGSTVVPATGGYKRPPRIERERDDEVITVVSLNWLQDHQSKDGSWSATEFDEHSKRRKAEGHVATRNIEFVRPGEAAGDEGVPGRDSVLTALALSSYLGSGYDHKEGDYKAVTRQAVFYLRRFQSNDGSFVGAANTRDAALIVFAMWEAFGLSGDQVLKPIADKACDYLLSLRVPGSGWGEKADAEPNLLDTFYAVLALKAAQLAGRSGDTKQEFQDAGAFLDTLVRNDGSVWYTLTVRDAPRSQVAGHTRDPINAAAWIVATVFAGTREPQDAVVASLAQQLVRPDALPLWSAATVDYEYWWIGTLACFQCGQQLYESATIWDAWDGALSEALITHQRGAHPADVEAGHTDPKLLDEHGSWDAVSPWNTGGRIEATCYATLTTQTRNRYLKYVLDQD